MSENNAQLIPGYLKLEYDENRKLKSAMIDNLNSLEYYFTVAKNGENIIDIEDQNSNTTEKIEQYLKEHALNDQKSDKFEIRIAPEIFHYFSSLETLKLWKTVGLVLSLKDLNEACNLRCLAIKGEGGHFERRVQLENSVVEDLKRFEELEEVELVSQKTLKGDLSSLDTLKKLRKLRICDFTRDEYSDYAITGDVNQFLLEHLNLSDLDLGCMLVEGVINAKELKKQGSKICTCDLDATDCSCSDTDQLYALACSNNHNELVQKFHIEYIDSHYYRYYRIDTEDPNSESYGSLIDDTVHLDRNIFKSVKDYSIPQEVYNEDGTLKSKYLMNIASVEDLQSFKFFFRLPADDNARVEEIDDLDLVDNLFDYILLYQTTNKLTGEPIPKSTADSTDESSDEPTNKMAQFNKKELKEMLEGCSSDLDGKLIVEFEPDLLKNFPNLQSIDFSESYSLNVKLSDFKDLTTLKRLNIHQITESYLDDLPKISPQLEEISIVGEMGGNLDSIASLTGLKTLKLYAHKDPNLGVVSGNLASLSHLTNLEALTLRIPEEVKLGNLNALSNLTNLKELDISLLNAEGNLSFLDRLTKLERLVLSDFPDRLQDELQDLKRRRPNLYMIITEELEKPKGKAKRSLISNQKIDLLIEKMAMADITPKPVPHIAIEKTHGQNKTEIVKSDDIEPIASADFPRVHRSAVTRVNQLPDSLQTTMIQGQQLPATATSKQSTLKNTNHQNLVPIVTAGAVQIIEDPPAPEMLSSGSTQGLGSSGTIQVSDGQFNYNIGLNVPRGQLNNNQERGTKRKQTESAENQSRELSEAESLERPYKKQCYEMRHDNNQKDKSNGSFGGIDR